MRLRVLGVMTGTSCDGLDAACLEFTRKSWRTLWCSRVAYPALLRKRVLAAQVPSFSQKTLHWMELDRDLGTWYGQTLKKMVSRQSSKDHPDVIANHGQTIAHYPDSEVTLQLGDPARIAAATGITTVARFRDGDLAVGGQGAPLVPRFHFLLSKKLAHSKGGISLHNLGGISNFTYIHPNQREVFALDTGPGNVWIDAAVEKITNGKYKFDREGRMAASTEPHLKSVQALMKHPYFKKSAPKSTGRDDFSLDYFFSRAKERSAALVATATEVSARSIADAYQKYILGPGLPLRTIYFCGGGVRNRTLIESIAVRLPGVAIGSLSEAGFDERWIEAQAFAYFGYLALQGIALGGVWTGAKKFGPPAHIIPAQNWRAVLSQFK